MSIGTAVSEKQADISVNNSAVLSLIPSFSKTPVISTRLHDLVSNSTSVFCDFNGCVVHDELHQMKAFTELLNEKTRKQHDFRNIAKEMVGKSERQILTEFKEHYGLKGNLENLLQRREDLYLNRVFFEELKLNHDLVWTVNRAKELDLPTAILSNGRERIIRAISYNLNIHHLFDSVYTVDCKQREADKKFADKIAFLEHISETQDIDLSRTILFEDSVRTLEKAKKVGIQGVYVDHILTADHHYVPNTGIVLRFPEPC